MTGAIKTAVEVKQEIIDRIKSNGYIKHLEEKYGVDLSRVESLQDILIEEIYIGVIEGKKSFTSN